MGPDAIIFVFWVLSFKPAFSFSSFTFIKRLFGPFSLSAIRMVSSAYLSLLIFLPAVLISACYSSSPAFCMMYSTGVMVKNPPAMQETYVWSLGWEDPLNKGIVTHSSMLAGWIPWTEEPGGLQFMKSQRVRYGWATNIVGLGNFRWEIVAV